MGVQYSKELLRVIPNFEAMTDRSLKQSFPEFAHDPDGAQAMTFERAVDAAKHLMSNMPDDHQDELNGMASVFQQGSDMLGNGRLSMNKMLVSLLQSEATRIAACSAAAVFGGASVTGQTIVGRNNNWTPDEDFDDLNAIFIFHNGSKSIGGNGSLGELLLTNIFNCRHMYAGSLDSYPSLEALPMEKGSRSLSADLRYAMETFASLEEVEEFLMANGNYVQGSIALFADLNCAHVFEYDISRSQGQRGLVRTSTSELMDGVRWEMGEAIVSVNSYLLPSGYANHLADAHNRLRFDQFRRILKDDLERGPITVDQMRALMGFTSQDGSSLTSGAIFRLGVHNQAGADNATFQSLVMRLDTYETWLAYSAAGASTPYVPAYHKVLDGDPFS